MLEIKRYLEEKQKIVENKNMGFVGENEIDAIERGTKIVRKFAKMMIL